MTRWMSMMLGKTLMKLVSYQGMGMIMTVAEHANKKSELEIVQFTTLLTKKE